jgi:low temperature requirement protein LtrA
MRHVIKFGVTILVYFVGTYHLGKLEDKWMSQLWHFIHISLLFGITAIGAYDWVFGMVDKKTKELAATMQEFLISPVLYVAMGILNKRLNKDQQGLRI